MFRLILIMWVIGVLCFGLFVRFQSLGHSQGKSIFRSSPSAKYLFARVNLICPLPTWAEYQVPFIGFPCAWMTLHEFTSCLGPYRGQVVFFLSFWYFASSSKGFAYWFDPVLSNLDFWCLKLDFLVFVGVFTISLVLLDLFDCFQPLT